MYAYCYFLYLKIISGWRGGMARGETEKQRDRETKIMRNIAKKERQ